MSNSVKHLDISVFDVLKNMFGDKFHITVDKHINNSKENINSIKNALDNNNAKELEQAAHSLKGTSSQFGAIVLSELAEQMEQFAITIEFEKAKQLFPVLKSEREKLEELMLLEINQ